MKKCLDIMKPSYRKHILPVPIEVPLNLKYSEMEYHFSIQSTLS